MAKDYELRIINKPVYYIEMVALLHRLTNDRSYRGIMFSDEQGVFLDLLDGFRIKGLELFELFLYEQEVDDIDRLQEHLFSLKQLDFLYQFFGEELTKEELLRLSANFDSVPAAAKKNMYLSAYSYESLEALFIRTEEFISQLADIFKAINTEVVKQMAKYEDYEEAVSRVSLDLKSKVPLAVAQGIMGKKFVRVYDFTTYYFVPSFFYMSKPMRTFNKVMQILVYPIGRQEAYDKYMLAEALKVIADKKRLEIIQKLSVRPMYGKELAGELGLVTSTVSHHLEQLRSIGLINEERDRSVKYFSLNVNEYSKLCEAMKSFINN